MRPAPLFVILTAAACTPQAGDFCDVMPGPLAFQQRTARAIVQNDRPLAERIAVLNGYHARHCRGNGRNGD